MAVNTKGKRKVIYKGRPFIWSVEEKETQVPEEGGFVNPTPARYVHIIATNKSSWCIIESPMRATNTPNCVWKGNSSHASLVQNQCKCHAGSMIQTRTPQMTLCGG
ncbi:MAG: hypothetical protein HC804_00070 [Anaerolineae bacterium]|nr:hypothetical protein [Anaerolineae bacterium]